MTKIKRDALAFAARVKMSGVGLWLIVEGRTHDRAFYDRVLAAHQGSAREGYRIQLAEQLDLEGKSAGGKPFALKLFDLFEARSLLCQRTKNGSRRIAFALDRDHDHFAGTAKNSAHVLYTAGMDVEADIIRTVDVRQAAGVAYSLPVNDVATAVPTTDELFRNLADLYREWIRLGVVVMCGTGDSWRSASGSFGRYSQLSEFNGGSFGPADAALVSAAEGELEDRLPGSARERVVNLRARVDVAFVDRVEWRLVKGKWIAKYVGYLIRSHVEQPIERVSPDTLMKAAVAMIDSNSPLLARYHRRLDLLLAS